MKIFSLSFVIISQILYSYQNRKKEKKALLVGKFILNTLKMEVDLSSGSFCCF
jgi:hypothetical protein